MQNLCKRRPLEHRSRPHEPFWVLTRSRYLDHFALRSRLLRRADSVGTLVRTGSVAALIYNVHSVKRCRNPVWP